MSYTLGWKFMAATALLSINVAYILTVGADQVTAIAWSIGGFAIGFGFADVVP